MKQKVKKTAALLLSIIMLCSFSVPFNAFAEEEFSPLMIENPFYAGEEVSVSTIDELAEFETHSAVKKYDSQTYYSNGIELYKIIRDNLSKRNESFKLYYITPKRIITKDQLINVVKGFFTNSTEEALAEECNQGDYIRWAVKSYGYNGFKEITSKDGYYYCVIDATYKYYGTASEEKEVDKIVNSFISEIDESELCDCEIIRKVNDFICSKTSYDYDALVDITGKDSIFTAYGALLKGKCVCQGYALAFYRICRELGYNVRFVSSSASKGRHAWNIIQLDGKYYFADATWGDRIIDNEEEFSPYRYFLVNYETIKQDDKNDEHVLDEKFYETEYFWSNYRNKIDENNYDFSNKSLFSQSIITLSKNSYVYSGEPRKPSVNISSSEETAEYKVSYKNNTNTGFASADIYSSDGSALLSHRNFVILPKKMSALSAEQSGVKTESLTLKWNKAAGNISGYSLEMYKSGKWSAVKTLSSTATTAKITSLSPASIYKFRIRSFVNVSSRKYYGAYSNVFISATKPKTPAVSSVSPKSKSITLKWKSVNCSGYEIEYSTYKSMKNAKSVTASSTATSKKISNLKKGKKYYVRVRAVKNYTTASGKSSKVYSSWSTKKNIVCK